ncbi:MAG: hypothetical protein LBT83_03770 [Tannerella sp.]|nr:hypothetical protein [Tannerella sp.]
MCGIAGIVALFCCAGAEGNVSDSPVSGRKNAGVADAEAVVDAYMRQAEQYLNAHDLPQAKVYLDSAGLYEKDVTDPEVAGTLYMDYGLYYSLALNDLDAHQNYYKALACFEKAGKTDMSIPIYHNLAFSYIQKEDTSSLKKIIDRMLPLALKHNDPTDRVNTYRIMAFYFDCMYEKSDKQAIYLDSAIYYDTQVLSLFESAGDALHLRAEEIAYDYVHYASNQLKRGTTRPDTLVAYVDKAGRLSHPADTAMRINLYWLRGEIAYRRGQLDDAEQVFHEQLALMNRWQNPNELSMYLDLYDRLSEIAKMTGKHREALALERQKTACLNQIHDAQKYEIVREMETKYEVSLKEQEIIRLTELNHFRRKTNQLYFWISLSGFTALIFVISWLRSKKKEADSRLALVRIEKKEAALQTQLKEEQLKKMELEKYEALLDTHFKKQHISGLDSELEALREEQCRLNEQVGEYADRVQRYENRALHEWTPNTSDPYFSGIVRDVYDLISKRMDDVPEKNVYLEKLSLVRDDFLIRMLERCADLSVLTLKYGVCFFIDMKVTHMAGCFSIETRTVHMIRYRLKTRLRIGKDVNLCMYLKQITA